MNDKLSDIDAISKAAWNESYRLSRSDSLWSDDAVPYAARAADLFRARGCHLIGDMPCGDGRNMVVLAKALPFVMAFDASENALGLASRRAAISGLRNCVFVHGDIFHTPFPNSQFDGIFCWDLLGHIKAIENALIELIRTCRQNGYIIGSLFGTSDPNRGIEMQAVGKEEFIYKDRYYYRFYSKDEIRRLLNSFDVQLMSLHLEVWDEPGHEGFREYPHTHHSWVFNLQKN
jgi:ubiquinone/menaquinone biosynthesis C-methylase UbiE